MSVRPSVRASGRSAHLEPREILSQMFGRTDRAKEAVMDTLRAAGEDFAGVVELTRELVRIPSRGGIDSYDPVLGVMAAWLGRMAWRAGGWPGLVVRWWR